MPRALPQYYTLPPGTTYNAKTRTFRQPAGADAAAASGASGPILK
jgi:hypothetical protein